MIKFDILSADLKYIMSALKPALGKSYSRPECQCIKFECTDGKLLRAYATDGYRLHSVSTGINCESESSFSFLLKPFTVPKNDSSYISCELSKEEISFDFGYQKISFRLKENPDNFLEINEAIPKEKPNFRIGFNPKFIEEAAKSLKQSGVKDSVIMEIRNPLEPVMIYLSKDKSDFRLVLPVRIKSEEA